MQGTPSRSEAVGVAISAEGVRRLKQYREGFLAMVISLSRWLGIVALSASTNLWAVAVGEQLPVMEDLTGLEEIRVNADGVKYVTAQLQGLEGKVLSIYHLAPRVGLDLLHKPFFDELLKQDFPEGRFQGLTIASMDEAVWGTTSLVKTKFEDNAKQKPAVRFMLDEDSRLRDTWNLKKNGAVVILVDAKGKILAVKEGEVKPEEVEPLLALIRAQF